MAPKREALPRTPLQRFKIMETAELGALEASADNWFTPCRVRAPSRAAEKKARATVSATNLGSVKLVYAHTVGSDIAVDFMRQESDYVIVLSLAGINQVTVLEEQAICSAQRAAILSPQMAANMHLSDGYAQLHLCIKRAALEQHLERMLDRVTAKPIRFEMNMDLTSPALVSWLRGVKVLLEDLDEPSGLSAAGAHINPWSDFLMSGLLLAQPHNYSELLTQGRSHGFRPQSLSRAVELIEQEPAGDLSLTRLSAVAGVGPRALQRYFREYMGISPREYIQRVRLEGAHGDLHSGAGQSVTEIALRWGFTHVSRFAGAYQQRYGILPSATLRTSGHAVKTG